MNNELEMVLLHAVQTINLSLHIFQKLISIFPLQRKIATIVY